MSAVYAPKYDDTLVMVVRLPLKVVLFIDIETRGVATRWMM